MKNKIDFIIENDRFPLSKSEWIFLGGIYFLIIALAIFGITYLKNIVAIVGVILFVILLCVIIYSGFISSLQFKKITTGFSEQQNKKLIILCMNHLKFKIFQDQSHDNVYVCFVHSKNIREERQEIYLIAKKDYILINSNKEKDEEDTPGKIDFVDKIGITIYRTAISLRKRQNFN